MRRRALLVVLVVVVVAAFRLGPAWRQPRGRAARPTAVPTLPAANSPETPGQAPAADTLLAFLPDEARETVRLIAAGGPFPHRQDGSVFGNREGRLPARQRGYYREYTVPTPALDSRGARRIITGGTPPEVWYYTDDHYQSFRSFEGPR